MLIGLLVFECALLLLGLLMLFRPRAMVGIERRFRLTKRGRQDLAITRRRLCVTVAAGLVVVGLVVLDWSALRLGWQGGRVPTSTSGTLSAADARRVDALITPAITSGDQMGLVVGITDGGTTWVRGYGRRSVSSNQPPDGNSVFEIGSVTKTFTCTALAAMVLAGKVGLRDPVSKYLPKSVHVPTYRGREVTLEDLATQTSGLPRMPDNMGLMSDISDDPYAAYTPEQMYEFLSLCKLDRAPGSKYDYSNLGMGLLGLALSRKAGVGYEQMVDTLVCKPLGLRHSGVTLSGSQKSRMATGYALQTKLGRLLIGVPTGNWTFQDSFAGAGALRSTADDMLRYLRANIDAGSDGLGPAMAMTRPTRHKIDDTLSIGLGWHAYNVPWSNEPVIWHNGGTGGYCSFVGFCPQRKLGVVVLGNSDGDVDILALQVMKAILTR